MKRLELFKAIAALSVLASSYNSYFDLVEVPRRWDVHLALSLLCTALFLIGLYHDQLGRKLLKKAKEVEHLRFPMTRQASSELLFTEGLLTFLFAIPVIPVMLSFPEEPHLVLSVLLFPLHGSIRCYRTRFLKNLELIIGQNALVLTLRSPFSIRYQDMKRVELKYEHLYIVLKDKRVRTLPLAFLEDEGKEALGVLKERFTEVGIRGAENLQPSSSSTKSRE